MKHKLTILITTIALLTGAATALEANLQDDTPIELEPEQSHTLSFDLESTEELEVQDVQVTDTNSEDYSFNIPIGQSSQDTPGVLELEIVAPEFATSENITFELTGERNGTEVSTQVQGVEVITEEPTFQIFKGWMNTNQEATIGNTTYIVSDLENSLFLKEKGSSGSSSIEIAQNERNWINDQTYLNLHSAVPSSVTTMDAGLAEIEVQSMDEDLNFNLSKVQTEPEKCTLGLELGGAASSINRGELNIFYTIDQETGDRVPNVEVVISERDGGSIVKSFVTDENGRKSLVMPDQITGEQLFFEFMYIGDDNQYSNCDPNERIVELSQTYEDWLENEEAYQLNMELNRSMMTEDGELYGNLTGSVTNNEDEPVENAVLEITDSNGETVTEQISGTEFEYQFEERGQYEVQLTKSAFLESEATSVNYQDECPNVNGLVENNGCLEQDVSLRIFNSEGDTANSQELTPNEQYIFRIYNEEGEVEESFGETLTVTNEEGEEMELPFEQGVARTSFDNGQYSVEFEGSNRYTEIRSSVQSGSSVLPEVSPMLLGGGIAGVMLLLGIILYLSGGSSNGGGSRSRGGDNTAPRSLTGGGSGSSITKDDLQNNLEEN